MSTNSEGQSDLPHPSSTAYEILVWGQGVVVTDMKPDQLLDQAATYMASRGFIIEQRIGNTINFSFHEGPEVFLGCFLLLLGIVPGVLYFVLAGGNRRITVLANEEGEGTRVFVSGDSKAPPLYQLRDWVISLPGSVVPR
jgi:hypothetical protein